MHACIMVDISLNAWMHARYISPNTCNIIIFVQIHANKLGNIGPNACMMGNI